MDAEVVKISLSEDTYINVNPKEFHEIKNEIVLLDDYGYRKECKFIKLQNDCWLLVPKDLVQKPKKKVETIQKIEPTFVERPKKKKK